MRPNKLKDGHTVGFRCWRNQSRNYLNSISWIYFSWHLAFKWTHQTGFGPLWCWKNNRIIHPLHNRQVPRLRFWVGGNLTFPRLKLRELSWFSSWGGFASVLRDLEGSPYTSTALQSCKTIPTTRLKLFPSHALPLTAVHCTVVSGTYRWNGIIYEYSTPV